MRRWGRCGETREITQQELQTEDSQAAKHCPRAVQWMRLTMRRGALFSCETANAKQSYLLPAEAGKHQCIVTGI